MQHRRVGRKLGRVKKLRLALLKNLAVSLILKGSLTTTEAKAKALRPFVEKLITIAKRKTGLAAKRQLTPKLYSAEAVTRLLKTYKDRYQNRAGGYTRILKVKRRFGDNAPLAKIELV